MSRGGNLATACGGITCFTALTEVTSNICSNTLATGNGPGTVYLCWRNNNGVTGLAVGSHTGTLTIGTTTINITLVVVAPRAYDAFVNKPGYPSGCTNSASRLPTCRHLHHHQRAARQYGILDPGGGRVLHRPAVRSIRCAASRHAGYNIQYSSVTAFSASSTYILVNDSDGFVHVYNRVTATQAYGPLAGRDQHRPV